ncbi:MAG: glutaredoxin 3 [Alphaproteobacteria bacterium]|jgi:glutaredoxin 3
MAEVVIYSKDYCPYCVKAKNLLKQKGQIFREIDITHDEKLQQEVVTRSGGRRTVPQIFVGDTHVGGFDDLAALDKAGKLDALLKM